MTTPDIERGIALLRELESRQPPPLAESTCRHCGKRIVFEPYFLDGKEPNPPIWYHPPGSETCSTRPDDWPVKYPNPGYWPCAEPVDPEQPK